METVTEEVLEEKTNYLLTYDLQQTVIDNLKEQAYSIKVSSWEDEENCKAARKLRTEIKAVFEKVDRRRKDLKNFIDKKGKAVTALIDEPIKYLDSQIAIRDSEIKRQKEEAEKAIQDTIKERSAQIEAEGDDVEAYFLHPEACNEEKFQKLLAKAKESRAIREAKEAQELKEAQEREAKERADQAELAKLRAENEKLKVASVPFDIQKESEAIVFNAGAHPESKVGKINLLNIYLEQYTLEGACLRIIELESKVKALETEIESLTEEF